MRPNIGNTGRHHDIFDGEVTLVGGKSLAVRKGLDNFHHTGGALRLVKIKAKGAGVRASELSLGNGLRISSGVGNDGQGSFEGSGKDDHLDGLGAFLVGSDGLYLIDLDGILFRVHDKLKRALVVHIHGGQVDVTHTGDRLRGFKLNGLDGFAQVLLVRGEDLEVDHGAKVHELNLAVSGRSLGVDLFFNLERKTGKRHRGILGADLDAVHDNLNRIGLIVLIISVIRSIGISHRAGGNSAVAVKDDLLGRGADIHSRITLEASEITDRVNEDSDLIAFDPFDVAVADDRSGFIVDGEGVHEIALILRQFDFFFLASNQRQRRCGDNEESFENVFHIASRLKILVTIIGERFSVVLLVERQDVLLKTDKEELGFGSRIEKFFTHNVMVY